MLRKDLKLASGQVCTPPAAPAVALLFVPCGTTPKGGHRCVADGAAAVQVALVWDALLWAAALRGKICSQDGIADLLQV